MQFLSICVRPHSQGDRTLWGRARKRSNGKWIFLAYIPTAAASRTSRLKAAASRAWV
jgi:hypothetical protein